MGVLVVRGILARTGDVVRVVGYVATVIWTSSGQRDKWRRREGERYVG
jgi:hypothetical protein